MPRLSGFADCLSASRPVHLELGGLAVDAVFAEPAARVVLNLVLLAAECLPGGGTVALSGSAADGVLVTISGPRAAWPAGFANWLNDEAEAARALIADPRRLQAPLTALLGRRPGMRLTMLMPTGPMGSATAPPLLLSLH